MKVDNIVDSLIEENDNILVFIIIKDVRAYLIKGDFMGVYYAVVTNTGITQFFVNIENAKAFYNDVKAYIRAMH